MMAAKRFGPDDRAIGAGGSTHAQGFPALSGSSMPMALNRTP